MTNTMPRSPSMGGGGYAMSSQCLVCCDCGLSFNYEGQDVLPARCHWCQKTNEQHRLSRDRATITTERRPHVSRIYYVYFIINQTAQRLYVGITTRPQQRWSEHRRALRCGRHHTSALQADWDAHGESAFTFSPIDAAVGVTQCPPHLEAYWIALAYRSGWDIYNSTGVHWLYFDDAHLRRGRASACDALGSRMPMLPDGLLIDAGWRPLTMPFRTARLAGIEERQP